MEIRRLFNFKKKQCDTGVLVLSKDGRVLIGLNTIPEDKPAEVSEATIQEVENFLKSRMTK